MKLGKRRLTWVIATVMVLWFLMLYLRDLKGSKTQPKTLIYNNGKVIKHLTKITVSDFEYCQMFDDTVFLVENPDTTIQRSLARFVDNEAIKLYEILSEIIYNSANLLDERNLKRFACFEAIHERAGSKYLATIDSLPENYFNHETFVFDKPCNPNPRIIYLFMEVKDMTDFMRIVRILSHPLAIFIVNTPEKLEEEHCNVIQFDKVLDTQTLYDIYMSIEKQFTYEYLIQLSTDNYPLLRTNELFDKLEKRGKSIFGIGKRQSGTIRTGIKMNSIEKFYFYEIPARRWTFDFPLETDIGFNIIKKGFFIQVDAIPMTRTVLAFLENTINGVDYLPNTLAWIVDDVTVEHQVTICDKDMIVECYGKYFAYKKGIKS